MLPLARMSKLKGGRAAIEADQIPGLAWKAGSPRSARSDSTKKLRAALEECRAGGTVVVTFGFDSDTT